MMNAQVYIITLNKTRVSFWSENESLLVTWGFGIELKYLIAANMKKCEK